MSIYNGNTRGTFHIAQPAMWIGVALSVTFGPIVLALIVAVLHWAWATS